ncbi:peptide deformylase [Oceanobacillus sp. M65]|uniref:Peptide deformylase n=1 Tax=Oceanobacillus jordanicus TaxID=2867266 RepID=A0AAW5B8R6_9BACI|nr:peptide deformylase [Oceanobacillus jordanicus]AVQ98901.1 peptide deformylase [Oceanobacillus iheyensis]MCG3420433.1 peptide deformylase [Oceanobacillus jordanicus]
MITMKDIVREGHPSLETSAEEVKTPLQQEERELLEEMLTFLRNSQDDEIARKYDLRAGVGLAAPQLGINKRLVAIHFEDFNGKLYSYGLVNPKIVSHSVEDAYLSSGEGCLSVDRTVEGYVIRHARITVKATDMDNNPLKLRLKGYAAIVFQHEIDHLNGIMFYDRINSKNPFSAPDNAKAID